MVIVRPSSDSLAERQISFDEQTEADAVVKGQDFPTATLNILDLDLQECTTAHFFRMMGKLKKEATSFTARVPLDLFSKIEEAQKLPEIFGSDRTFLPTGRQAVEEAVAQELSLLLGVIVGKRLGQGVPPWCIVLWGPNTSKLPPQTA